MSSPDPSAPDNVEVLYEEMKEDVDGADLIEIELIEQDEEFNYAHGDIRLRVKNTQFIIHSYHLLSFNHIVKKLRPRQTSISTIVKILKGEVDDFRNTLRILYSGRNACQGEEFDPLAWKSALWVATEYDDPDFRSFCIKMLDAQDLSDEERLWFAQEFQIPEWKKKVENALIIRSITLTAGEIGFLGPDLVANIMAKREQRMTQEYARPRKRLRTRK